MEKNMIKTVRRIVTTNDERGRSRILIDSDLNKTIGVLTELWKTDSTPASNAGASDSAADSDKLEPPRRGTLFRYFQIAPESASTHLSKEEKYKAAAAWFAEMNGSHLQPDTTRHQAMHKSKTTDYIILLSGQITLLLDDGEVDLSPFDCVVQRGTNHAWVNRGEEDALLMAVLVDADGQDN
jgi:mannose-6-phosphate isomerase-like protein (cupin superfamily)